ncbi:succinate-semialdehyde dehydrogenase (NADP(+)) [Lewinellaceae bacterium SD302]|nr:succinate-semialdehyde dehydrogenase (NADP(+)) [Lewinellaceae bacterium SD302]
MHKPELSDQSLFRTAAYINGEWKETSESSTFTVQNPATGKEIAEVTDIGAEMTSRAIEAADRAFPSWRDQTAGERAKILRRWYELIMEHQEDLALLLTLEQGKPLSEARSEITYGASFIQWFAEEARRVYGDVIPSHAADKRITVIKQPVGVVAAITPWNFPNAMITRKVAPALAVGCTVVIKPAEDTPLSALALAELADRAGFPAGVLNVLPTSRPKEVGGVLTESFTVRKLSFTGSTAVGKQLMKQCAGTLKKLSLELGGNAPFIVFDDADLDAAVEGAIASKFRNAGQTCVCSNRIYVQDSVREVFVDKLAAAMKKLKVGDGRKKITDIGPLINAAGLEKVKELLEDALDKGASLVIGGETSDQGELFYQPTLLTGANAEMRLAKEEIFGPIAPVFTFETEKEAIELANATSVGLAAYFYGRDYARIWRVAEALEYGMVGINTGMISTTVAPFGGVKESGFGREGSKYGVEDYLDIKYMCWGGVN